MTTKKDAVLTLKWKTDWLLGCDSTAGLEVGSVSSGLRLQDLQIKGKPEKGKSMCAEALRWWVCEPGAASFYQWKGLCSKQRMDPVIVFDSYMWLPSLRAPVPLRE